MQSASSLLFFVRQRNNYRHPDAPFQHGVGLPPGEHGVPMVQHIAIQWKFILFVEASSLELPSVFADTSLSESHNKSFKEIIYVFLLSVDLFHKTIIVYELILSANFCVKRSGISLVSICRMFEQFGCR